MTHHNDIGPAELSGKIEIGDNVVRVNGTSTSGLDYGSVLDIIIGAPRPVTIHFERPPRAGTRGGGGSGGAGAGAGAGASASSRRVEHTDWNPAAAAALAGARSASPPEEGSVDGGSGADSVDGVDGVDGVAGVATAETQSRE